MSQSISFQAMLLTCMKSLEEYDQPSNFEETFK